MESSAVMPALAAARNTVKYYYSKRNEAMASMAGLLQRNPALGRQPLAGADSSHASPCNNDGKALGQFELGAFYEIDHAKLPPKSPIQLKAIRVVKVSETTRLDVTVRFPSTLSLRNHFAGVGTGEPELDERFVMSINQATRILRRQVPDLQLEGERHLEGFWLLDPPKLHEFSLPLLLPPMQREEEEVAKKPSTTSGCLLALKCAGLVGWGVRRKVKYIGRHREMPAFEIKEEEANQGEDEEEKPRFGCKRARTRDYFMRNKRKKVKEARDKKKPRREERKLAKGSKDRWSAERYEAAELKLLEIMREKRARLGCPILRQELRDEARKHIGDTGLLDHLLKHMAGKNVANGSDRFRRRHNADGAMEYWLEPADLVEIRCQAGVVDPYWVPPPGWKLGDSISPCSCDAKAKQEVSELKEELATLKREVEQLKLSSVKLLEKEAQSDAHDNGYIALQEGFKSLLEWRTKLEVEVAGMGNHLQALQEEMRLLQEDKTKGGETKGEVVAKDKDKEDDGGDDKEEGKGKGDTVAATNNSSDASHSSTTNNTADNGTKNNFGGGAGGGFRRAARKSGFTICKPQGTFLWPDMVAGGAARIGSANRMVVPTARVAEDQYSQLMMMMYHGGIPTPPSASSATSAPRLFVVPGPTSPSLPRASGPEVVPAVVPPACFRMSSCESTCINLPRGSSSSSSVLPGGGGREAKKRKEAGVPLEPAPATLGSESITWTDLALATPTPHL